MLDFDVVVVGAGLSGLMASLELKKAAAAALKVCVVEARDRIGGRTETLPAPHHLDVGAQWVGPKHSELISLVNKYELKLVEQYYPAAAADAASSSSSSSGRLTECVGFTQCPLPEEDARQVATYVELIETLSKELDVAQPWLHPLAKLWDHMSVQDHVFATVPENCVEARREVLLFAQTVFACLPSNTSFLFFLFCLKSGGGMEALADGENGAQKWKIEGGVSGLCDAMRREAEFGGGGVEFRLGSAVESVSCEEDEEESQVTVGLRNGQRIVCRRVIFALSPVLMRTIAFSPNLLPPSRVALQDSMVSGRAIKVIMHFDEAFWLEPAAGGDVTAVGAAAAAVLTGPIHNLFDSCTTAATADDGKPAAALVGLITGRTAMDMEPFSLEERRARIEQQLREMYKVLPPMLAYFERVWGLEEFSAGCYAGLFPATGVFYEHGHALRQPVASNRLFFAATETATEHYGYMEGALLAGQRAAREALNLLMYHKA